MSKLPLNIPYLLKRLRPDAKYVMHGRSYGDIQWMDTDSRCPSIEELENEFLRIQGLEERHTNICQDIEAKAKQSAHETVMKAKSDSEAKLSEIRKWVDDEVTKIDREWAESKAKLFASVEKHRKERLADIERLSLMMQETLEAELGRAFNNINEERGEKAYKNLVVDPKRAAAYPSKKEMQEAIKGGAKGIRALADKMRGMK